MNFYSRLIKSRYKKSNGLPHVEVLGPWFTNHMSNIEINAQTNCDQWAYYFQNGQLLLAIKICMPINLPGHWVACVILPEERRIKFQDSLGNYTL